jgi:hypothetical protein
MSRNKILPYPLFGKKGYTESAYSGRVCSVDLSGNEYKINVQHLVKNEEIIARIKAGELVCVTSAENSSFFKQSFLCDEANETSEIKIPRNTIRGRFEIDFTFKICASKDINAFSNTKFSSLYNDYKFNFVKGQIVGEAETITLQLDAGYEQLEQSSSFLRFRAHSDIEEERIEFKIFPDHVTFYLPQETHKEYKDAHENGSRALLGILVAPAIMQLISHIRRDEKEYNDPTKYSWISTLIDRCGELELFDQEENEIELTRVILDEPTKKSIHHLNVLLKQIDEL